MQKEVIYNKLIRDNILDIIEKNGQNCEYHIADEKEYSEKLFKKVIEELNEFIENPSEEEMADILEVLDAIIKLKNLNKSQIEILKNEKAVKRGKFEKKLILEKVYEK